jgi:glutamate-1-semialdehyde 2,1-aminomutase
MNLSQNLFERSQRVAPGGVHSPVRSFRSVGGTPIFFKKANGAYLYDVEEKQYIDFCMSFGPLIFGHRDPEIEEVVKETISLAWSFGACEPYSLELAEYITSHVPHAEKIRFVSSGTEAVMSALRVARAYNNREKILKFDGCYHGHADALLVKSGSGLAGEASSDSAGIGNLHISQTLVLPLDDEAKVKELFDRQGREIAAVIIEPLPANYGLLVQRKAFIETVMQIAKSYHTLVIFDEVISGFRVGFRGMAERFEQKPDLVTYGKIIGGGFPVGAYAGKKELMDLVAPAGPVYQAGTLSANPVGMRAGLATLKKLSDGSVYKRLENRTSMFIKEMTDILNKSSDINWSSTTDGSIFWFHKKTKDVIRTIENIPADHKTSFASLFHKLLKQGIYLAPSGFEVGFLSDAHTEDILTKTLEQAKLAMK